MIKKPERPIKPKKPEAPEQFTLYERIPALHKDGTVSLREFDETPWPDWNSEKSHLWNDDEDGDGSYVHEDVWDGTAQPENTYDAIKKFANFLEIEPQKVKVLTYHKWESDDEPNIYFQATKHLERGTYLELLASYDEQMDDYKEKLAAYKLAYSKYKERLEIWKLEENLRLAKEDLIKRIGAYEKSSK